jgi:microcystin-dependent protein
MANYEATRYDFDGANLTGIEGIPTGTITPWSQATPPTGFLECDGTAVSRSTYAALFAIISDTYGAGDGSTTFNLPNLTDRLRAENQILKTLHQLVEQIQLLILVTLQVQRLMLHCQRHSLLRIIIR